jgi:hypothetical protein
MSKSFMSSVADLQSVRATWPTVLKGRFDETLALSVVGDHCGVAGVRGVYDRRDSPETPHSRAVP